MPAHSATFPAALIFLFAVIYPLSAQPSTKTHIQNPFTSKEALEGFRDRDKSETPGSSTSENLTEQEAYQGYLNFFEEVFEKVRNNYYQPVTRAVFERFLDVFDEKIYPNLKMEQKSNDYVRWRSAAYLVDHLKSSEDVFSQFYPPKPAKEYEETALGVRIDLGIEGSLSEKGYEVTHVEPRSDAYAKGLRPDHIIVEVDDEPIAKLEEERIEELFTPLADTVVKLAYLDVETKHVIEALSREYFKQTVFEIPIAVPHIYGIEIQRFNRKTAEDVFRFMRYFRQQGEIRGLVIDLRDNPGGPPLAARELLSFFLPPNEIFVYFRQKDQVKASLDVPEIPAEFRYKGPVAILIDEDSGSSSELFSGVMQKRDRAVLLGENSAGQVMLKSMFHFDDESMLLLITARGYYPDGDVFSFQGLKPDRTHSQMDTNDLVEFATKYLVYVNMDDAG